MLTPCLAVQWFRSKRDNAQWKVPACTAQHLWSNLRRISTTKNGPEFRDQKRSQKWHHQRNSDNNCTVVGVLILVMFEIHGFGLSESAWCHESVLPNLRRLLKATYVCSCPHNWHNSYKTLCNHIRIKQNNQRCTFCNVLKSTQYVSLANDVRACAPPKPYPAHNDILFPSLSDSKQSHDCCQRVSPIALDLHLLCDRKCEW